MHLTGYAGWCQPGAILQPGFVCIKGRGCTFSVQGHPHRAHAYIRYVCVVTCDSFWDTVLDFFGIVGIVFWSAIWRRHEGQVHPFPSPPTPPLPPPPPLLQRYREALWLTDCLLQSRQTKPQRKLSGNAALQDAITKALSVNYDSVMIEPQEDGVTILVYILVMPDKSVDTIKG